MSNFIWLLCVFICRIFEMESQSQIKATEEEEADGRDGDISAKEHSKKEYGGGAGAHKEIVNEYDKT